MHDWVIWPSRRRLRLDWERPTDKGVWTDIPALSLTDSRAFVMEKVSSITTRPAYLDRPTLLPYCPAILLTPVISPLSLEPYPSPAPFLLSSRRLVHGQITEQAAPMPPMFNLFFFLTLNKLSIVSNVSSLCFPTSHQCFEFLLLLLCSTSV